MKKDIKTIKALIEKNASIVLSTSEQKQLKGGNGNGQETNNAIITDDWVMF